MNNSGRLFYSISSQSDVKNSSVMPAPKQPNEDKDVKPFKFSPFQVSPSNKVDYALARVDDLLNFARRVNISWLN